MLRPVAARLRRLPGAAVVTMSRPLSSKTGGETLWEKNKRLREASEKELVNSRQRLCAARPAGGTRNSMSSHARSAA